MCTAVLLVMFNRPTHTRRVMERISEVRPSRLYIACDGPRPNVQGEHETVESLRKETVKSVTWPCMVATRFLPENLGCRHAVSSAISWFFEQEPEGIILEDDCLPHPDFFAYCTALLERYRDNSTVMHIAGYNPLGRIDTTASYEATPVVCCWGWASWRRAWRHYAVNVEHFEEVTASAYFREMFPFLFAQMYWQSMFEEMPKCNTWDYQWYYTVLKNHGVALIPCRNMVENIGFNDGTHYVGEGGRKVSQPAVSCGILRHPDALAVNPATTFALCREHTQTDRLSWRVIFSHIKTHPLFMFRRNTWMILVQWIEILWRKIR